MFDTIKRENLAIIVVPRYRLARKNHAGHIGYFCSKALMPLGRAGISQHGGDPDKMEPNPYKGNRPDILNLSGIKYILYYLKKLYGIVIYSSSSGRMKTEHFYS